MNNPKLENALGFWEAILVQCQSQSQIKEEGWQQEGHPAIKNFAIL